MQLDMEPGASVGLDGKYVQLPDVELNFGGGPDTTEGKNFHNMNYITSLFIGHETTYG